MRHFCTYFDKHYLSRGLVLYDSIAAHHASFRLYVCCFDNEAQAYLERLALPGLIPIDHRGLEAHDAAFLTTRATRSRIEYFFTSTPCWLRFLFARFPEVDRLTYVDADLCFYSSCEPVFAEIAEASIAVVEHRFPARLRHLERCGRFNVGWLSFRRDADGLACIESWRERCLEWCYDRIDGERFADQKYLDDWPSMFSSVVVLRHPGVDIAPWNLDACHLDLDGPLLRIDGAPLICFHFHGVKQLFGPLYESGLRYYGVELAPAVRRRLFEPYLRQLISHEEELRRAGLTMGRATSPRYVGTRWWTRSMRTLVDVVGLLASRTYLVAPSIVTRLSAHAAQERDPTSQRRTCT